MRANDLSLALCTGARAQCSAEEAPYLEILRRDRAAHYLATPTHANIREAFFRTMRRPESWDWPQLGPPQTDAGIDRWRARRSAQP